jgi:predicted nucleotidyltransferase
MPARKLSATLRALTEGRVDFILVGGMAAVVQGAPITTFDVDVVHSREHANIERLLGVLESLDAFYRIQPERRLKPNASHLSGSGHLNLTTRYGPLDLLGVIGQGRSYSDLLPHTTEIEIGDDLRVRVLDLETLIAIKQELAGDKDRLALPVLIRTLEEKRKNSS